jgi:hypothetical protein
MVRLVSTRSVGAAYLVTLGPVRSTGAAAACELPASPAVTPVSSATMLAAPSLEALNTRSCTTCPSNSLLSTKTHRCRKTVDRSQPARSMRRRASRQRHTEPRARDQSAERVHTRNSPQSPAARSRPTAGAAAAARVPSPTESTIALPDRTPLFVGVSSARKRRWLLRANLDQLSPPSRSSLALR